LAHRGSVPAADKATVLLTSCRNSVYSRNSNSGIAPLRAFWRLLTPNSGVMPLRRSPASTLVADKSPGAGLSAWQRLPRAAASAGWKRSLHAISQCSRSCSCFRAC